MVAGTTLPAWVDLDPYVEAYERQQARDGHADLADFLPASDHPLYPAVLRELIRVDLEFNWQAGRCKRVEDYLLAFPALRRDPQALAEIAFEEYRLRRQAGQDAAPADYASRFAIDPSDWPVLPAGNRSAASAPPADLEQAAAAYLELGHRLPANASPKELAAAFAVLPAGGASASLLRDLHRADPGQAHRLAWALTTLPAEGLDFVGFHLLHELGRGAFSRVYLATQDDLANRLVAVKITAALGGEAHTLARLQHTNIVPIYSVHRANSLQALCMPYFGATTLADVIRALRQLARFPSSSRWLEQVRHATRPSPDRLSDVQPETSYTDAVLGLAWQLADGLAHAHARGVLHQDLKPANILFSDDGRPMLLDFNLAQDTHLQGSAAVAFLGGTLPYMAPEQLAAFRAGQPQPDARGDLYGLGLILFELLTARYPFPLPTGATADDLSRLRASRSGPPPSVRRWNPAVTPALEAIVRRCLEAEPGERYQSALQLREDLQRQQANLPLRHTPEASLAERTRKWARRHPRLTSSYVVGAFALLLLAGLGGLYWWGQQQLARSESRKTLAQHQLARSESRNTLAQFRQELRWSRFLLSSPAPEPSERDEGAKTARRALDRYGALQDDDWRTAPAAAWLDPEELDQLGDDLGELFLLLARAERLEADVLPDSPGRAEQMRRALRCNQQAASCFRPGINQRAVLLQRAVLWDQTGRKADARSLFDKAVTLPLRTARDYYLAASQEMVQRKWRPARDLLRKARLLDPQDAFIYYALGICHARLGDSERALASFDTSIVLWPEFYGTDLHRGRAWRDQQEYRRALDDCNEVLRRRPGFVPALVDRALARAGLHDLKGAIADVTQALGSATAPTRLYFMCADFRDQAGDHEGARRDRKEGLRRRPTDELSWVARGFAQLPQDPAAALADFNAALRFNHNSLLALQDKAHVLAEYLDKPRDAIAALDRLVDLDPQDASARAGRGVLLARLGKRAAALADATAALEQDSQPATRYQVAGIYALTSRTHPQDRREALGLLAAALRAGYGLDLLAADRDLDPIRPLPEFRRLVAAAQTLHHEEVGHGRKP